MGLQSIPWSLEKHCNVKSKCNEVMIKRYALDSVAIVVLSTILLFG